jgi:hypothetical protein
VRESLTLHVEPELSNATLVAAFEGWNDAGESATGAVRYVEDAICAVPLAELDAEPYLDLTVRRPQVRRLRDGSPRIDWPATRFSYGSTDASRELVLGVGIEPHLRWRDYCDEFAALVARLKVQRVVLLGAYVADVVYSRPVAVSGFASEQRVLEAAGVEPSGYEGPTGIVGVLAERLRADGVATLSLWAGLPHYIAASPNPRGSLALVQTLTATLPLAIDESPLRRDAADFEQKISDLVNADPELSEYVRLLKKREFAQ